VIITFDYWIWPCPECGETICHILRQSWGRLEYVTFERLVEYHEMVKHGIRPQEVAGL
jgi:hypothetical protein